MTWRFQDIDPDQYEILLTVGMPEPVAVGYILARRDAMIERYLRRFWKFGVFDDTE